MKTWDQFYPFVLPQAIGCPNVTASFYIKQAAIKFLSDSGAWIDTLAAVPTVLGQAAYAFGASTAQQVLGIEQCRIDAGDPLDIGYDDEVLTDTANGAPTRVWTTDLINFNLWRAPDTAAQQIVNTVVLAPSQSATGVEDRIFALYVTDIAALALAQLLALPNKAWTNPAMAQFYADKADLNHAATLAKTGGARLKTRVSSIP